MHISQGNLMKTAIYKSPEGEARILNLYDSFQTGLGVILSDRNVNTRFGAGVILRLAAYAPQRITKMALFVPAGVVSVPITSMVFKVGLPYLLYTLFPSRKRLYRAVQWMGRDIEDDVLELIEAVFQHVRVEPEMPRPVAKAELAEFTAPTLVIAAEKDVMFPGEAVTKRAIEIFSNLTVVECLKRGTHYSTKPDLDYVNRRISEFLEETEERIDVAA
jgi:pimeloyl-ACP methyl ester carboxylesterase